MIKVTEAIKLAQKANVVNGQEIISTEIISSDLTAEERKELRKERRKTRKRRYSITHILLHRSGARSIATIALFVVFIE